MLAVSVSDSGSLASSQSSVNRDSGSSSHHRRHRLRCPSSEQHQVTSQCNGAGGGTEADGMHGHLPDDDATTEDGVSTGYETSKIVGKEK